MKKTWLSVLLVLATCLSTTVVAMAIPIVDVGQTYGIPFSDLYDKNGSSIDTQLTFNNFYFEIDDTNISKGADLVKNITISDDYQEVSIQMNEELLPPLPNTPNVVIDKLTVRSKKTVRKDGETHIRAGDVFAYDSTLRLRVGMVNTTQGDLSSDELNLTLHPGDTKTIQWKENTSAGDISIHYGYVATAYGRAYPGQTISYGYDNSLPSAIIGRNPNAKMTSIKIICLGQTSNLDIVIDGNEDDYIYINNNGTLSKEHGPIWNSDEYIWEDSINKTTHYIISDRPLSSAPYGDDKPKEQSARKESSNVNDNPNTGRGETGIAISGIFAIMVITTASVVIMTIRRMIVNHKDNA